MTRNSGAPRPGVGRGRAAGRYRRGASVLSAETHAFRGVLGAKVIICKPAGPEALGLLERVHGYLGTSFLPGRSFAAPRTSTPSGLQRPAG